MADWHTPTQVERLLATMWMKLEKSNVPLKDISEENLINYFGNKKPVAQKLQYELLFNSNNSFDPKSKQDSWRSKKEIHDNIYEEEDRRTMPVVTSHCIGHRLKNLEGRSLNNYICGEIHADVITSAETCSEVLYPTIRELLFITSCLPVSVASAERSFSTLRRLKTWLRSRIGQNRLTGLALLHVHRHITVSVDDIIDKFSKMRKRKIEFVI